MQGVRLEYLLSPIQFKIYPEEIISKTLENGTNRIKANRTVISKIRYADDIVILAETPDDRQRIIKKLTTRISVLKLKL